MSTSVELGTFSDVLFFLERNGIDKDRARQIVTQVFCWGVDAAMVRLHQPPVVPKSPSDAPPIADGQLSLIDAPAKPAKLVRPAAPRQIARTFPPDFTLSEPLIQFATNRGFVGPEIDRMWERFRDRNMAKGEKYADWNAAWRTWVNNQVEFKNRDQNQNRNKIDDRL